MDLHLPLGRLAGVPLEADVVGEITEADLPLLSEPRRPSSALQRITERHRALARALVIQPDMTNDALALQYNLSADTIRQLRRDPAFQDLVKFYSRSEDEVHFNTHDRIVSVTNLALDRLEEKLLDDEVVAEMTPAQIVEIATFGTDRTGHGATTTSVSLNINAGLADRMKAARDRARGAMVDITPNE